MNKVEEEFRKQRDKEKVNIRHQLRILNLQEKSDSNETFYNKVPKHEISEFSDNLSKIKQNVQYLPEPVDGWRVQSFRNGQDLEDSSKWQQPTGMKKWLKRQTRDYQGLSPTRPEPEGGGLPVMIVNRNGRPKCIHGNESHCSLCKNNFVSKPYELSRKDSQKMSSTNDAKLSSIPKSMVSKTVDSQKCLRNQLHSNPQNIQENGIKDKNGRILASDMNDTNFLEESMEEYEQHTKLCRTNSGRTFESHSYYALERRKEESQKLKENVRKKARDFEKRTRKYQSRDYDSDDSGSDVRETRHQRPHNGRNQKKEAYRRNKGTIFFQKSPHRNGARVKPLMSGHIPNGRSPSYPKSPNCRAIMSQQRIPTC
ncbi:uncharacterized protein CEXT_242291 [Caerostris extrusa]|uniref:Uncharacterized protein n=1 Tax=Caerostris extrusa TaxID=172846 RepID=A0AAV4Y836_CAEEX|nr:uncharacterized protein CEXT_242291 [Caerostris extrusa]